MFNGDISEAPPSYTPCSAVRITPYDGDTPDHDQAVTYRLEKPIIFVHVHRTRAPCLGTTLGRDEQQMPGLVGFTVPIDYEEADTAHALAARLQSGARRNVGPRRLRIDDVLARRPRRLRFKHLDEFVLRVDDSGPQRGRAAAAPRPLALA